MVNLLASDIRFRWVFDWVGGNLVYHF